MRNPNRIKPFLNVIEDYWNMFPDFRFTQVLVNMGIIPNFPGMWYYKEDVELLHTHEDRREVFIWISKIKGAQTLKDIDSDHIKAIMKLTYVSKETKQLLKDELNYRKSKHHTLPDSKTTKQRGGKP